jgi:hypothetical protein
LVLMVWLLAGFVVVGLLNVAKWATRRASAPRLHVVWLTPPPPFSSARDVPHRPPRRVVVGEEPIDAFQPADAKERAVARIG